MYTSKIWDRGWLRYDSSIFLNGHRGVFRYALGDGYLSTSTSSGLKRVHTFLAANLPLVDHNLAFRLSQISDLPSDWTQAENPRVPVVDGQFLYRDVTYSALNAGEGYGRLQALEPDERPNPRDIVLYETLPNELSRVAGIISTQPQTPLSHVDLRAKQNKIPNAFIRDALDMTEISSLVGEYVYLRVTDDEFEIREATKAEVDAHYESLRPTARQSPERDLSVQAIAPLSEIGFEDYDAFGVKAANVAELGKLGFPQGTVPDGFAIPFYFYDEFMKHNDLYAEVDELLADEEFLTDYDEQEDELKKLRKKIKNGESPEWMIEALETMHDAYPEGQSLRYRSSTNNEDLPDFSGAGLYDSNTQKPKETEEDGIDKSMKQVFASLWNFRAFVERGFYRIDHSTTAMGILVHPNYTDERVNGVAVSFDPLYGKAGHHYVNSQVGEDLVTNPDAYSLPEELLLTPDGSYGVLHYSNQQENGQLLMTESQMKQLRRNLDTIHAHFDELYDIEAYAIEIEFKITSDDVLAIKQARPWVFGSDAPPLPDRAGTLTLSPTQPRVGAAVTASLTDPDGSISNITWQWAGSPNGSSNWANIGGAASAVYTPVAGDVGNYLRALASYTDGHGSGKSARAVSANPVQVAPPPPSDRAGTVTLRSTQPRVGAALTASLIDPDGSISNITWQWAGSPNGSSNWANIGEAASAVYTPVAGDVADYLRAMATYTDGHGSGKSARAVSANPVQGAPPPPPPKKEERTTTSTGGGGSGGGGGFVPPAPPQPPRPVSNFRGAGQLFQQLSVNGTLGRVWRLIEASQRWLFYDPQPQFASFNTLRTVNVASDPPAVVILHVNRGQRFRGDQLHRGWNFVPVTAGPLTAQPGGRTQPVSQLFRPLADSGVLQRVWWLDSRTQEWKFYDPDPQFTAFNTLTTIDLAANPPVVLAVGVDRRTEFRGRTLYRGWNYVVMR